MNLGSRTPGAWLARMPFQRVTDFHEQLAVAACEVDGDMYCDGEVWANTESLERWRAAPKIPELKIVATD